MGETKDERETRLSQSMIYVAAHPDAPTHYYAAFVEEAYTPRERAKEIAAWVRDGAVVSRVTREESLRGMTAYLEAKKAKRAAKEAQQPDLFGKAGGR